MRLGAQTEKQKIFVEKLKKVSPNINENFDKTMEEVYGSLSYNFRVLCERGYFDRFSEKDYIDYLEKEIVCLKILKEDIIDNEGIL